MTSLPPVAPARRNGEATRQRLLRAALELFTVEGFAATTTTAIAGRAGVAEGTIYRHFQSKEQLFNEVYRAAQRWALKLVRDLEPDRALRPQARLTRVAEQLVAAAERDPAVVRMLVASREDRLLDERSREAAREFRESLQQVVAMGKSDGIVRSGPADLWAGIWLAVVTHALERVGAKEWAPDHAQVAQTIEAAWDAIASRSAPAAPGGG